MEFRDRLRISLARADMTQAGLARKLGTSPRVVSYWMTGDSTPSLMYLEGICKVLNVSADYLIFGRKDEIYGF